MDSKQLLDVAEKLTALAESIRTACEGKPEEPKPETPTVSLEQVRGVLADKSQQGYTTEVKNLIRKYGAERLSDISPGQFPEMLKEAEAIGSA